MGMTADLEVEASRRSFKDTLRLVCKKDFEIRIPGSGNRGSRA